MSDNTIRDQLAEILRERINFFDDDIADAPDAILAEFLVVPRAEVTMEFGISDRHGARVDHVGLRTEATYAATVRRAFGLPEAQAYERPNMPWSPIRPGEVPDAI